MLDPNRAFKRKQSKQFEYRYIYTCVDCELTGDIDKQTWDNIPNYNEVLCPGCGSHGTIIIDEDE